MSKKQLFLVRCEILGLLVHTLAANCEYSRSNMESLPVQIQMQLPKKRGKSSDFFITFLESTLNFEHFENTMSLIAQVFLTLLAPKDVLT